MIRFFVPARVSLSLLTLGAALASCSGGASRADAGDNVDASAAIPFELGTGLSQWEDIPASGAHVKLIMGPQGGYHVLGRVRFSGFAPDVNLRFRVTDISSGQVFNDATDVLHRLERQGLVNTGSAWESTSAELVIFTQIRSPTEAANHTVRWEATLEEVSTGRTARASREFIVDYP